MNFKFKVAVQWMVHFFPFSNSIHRLFQKHINGELWSEEHFEAKLSLANGYLKAFQEYSQHSHPKTILDFGAGYDLIIPLFFSKKGSNVYAMDRKNLLNLDLVNRACKKMAIANCRFETEVSLKEVNVEYRNFQEFENLELPSQFDLILSTVVFEYLSIDEIRRTLNWFKSLLTAKGLIMLSINYRDHWSHGDSSIGDYNFLKFSNESWKKYCPPQCSQNRLRHSDYMRCIEEIGFTIMHEQLTHGNKSEIEGLRIHKDFETYELDDLLVKDSFLVLSF